MTDLVDPNMYEYTYPEERENLTPFRLDVVWNGALESQDDYIHSEAWIQWNTVLQDLESNHPEGDWELSLYNTNAYPPELIKEHRNLEVDDED